MTYLLTDAARAVTWIEWKKLGGCGLSNGTEARILRLLGPDYRSRTTLGQLQDACIVAGREIARFAKDHLHKPEWAKIEYP